jgi:hypothetical protein
VRTLLTIIKNLPVLIALLILIVFVSGLIQKRSHD